MNSPYMWCDNFYSAQGIGSPQFADEHGAEKTASREYDTVAPSSELGLKNSVTGLLSPTAS